MRAEASTLKKERSFESIDRALIGFIQQLYAQRRRSAVWTPHGGAIVSDPVTADQILSAPTQFPKDFQLLELLGRNRFSTNGPEWGWRRDFTQRQYLRAAAAQNRETIAEVYRRRLAECDGEDPNAVRRALLAASMEIFYGALGCTVDEQSMLRFYDRVRPLMKRLHFFSMSRPAPEERAKLAREAQSLSRSYRAELEASPTAKALMAEWLPQTKDQIDNFDAADELMMNFFAAVESTAATLSSAIDRLGVYQDTQERLTAEVMADKACPQLECFINETLRFYPAVPFIVRRTTSDVEIEGLRVKAGSVILISIIGIHHHPQYWKSPDRFDCTRAEFLENTYDRRAFIPFSSGIRSCGGARLARVELSEGLKAFVRRFSVKRPDGEISFDYSGLMCPKSWDGMEIARRV